MARKQARLGSARRRGESWEARWRRPDGKESAKRGFPTERAALDFAAEQMTASRKARSGRGTYVDPNRRAPLFKDAATAWLATSPGSAPKTRVGYASIVHSKLIPEFGTMRVDRITPTDVKRFTAKQAKDGRAPGTVKSYLRVLGPIFEQAMDDEHLTRNPVKRVRLKAPPSKRATIITPSQAKLLASVVDEHYSALVLFTAFTGLRAGEVAALRWKHVDAKGLWLTIEASAGEVSASAERRSLIDLGTDASFHEKTTKSGRARIIRFPSFLVKLLGSPGDRDEYVFQTAHATPMRWDNFRRRVWTPAIEKAHASDPTFPEQLRFHDLRHTCVSVLIAAGFNMKAIQQHMGHSTITVTLDCYGHLFDDAFATLPDVLDKVFADAKPLTVIPGGKASGPRRRNVGAA